MISRSRANPTKPANLTRPISTELTAIKSSNITSDTDALPADPASTQFSRYQFDINKSETEQQKDPRIQNILKRLQNRANNLPFVLKHNLLYKLIKPKRYSKKNVDVIYLPSFMISSLLEACHDDPMTGAHFSFDRTYHKIKPRFWWPNIKSNIKGYINSCHLCKQFNIRRHKSHGHLRPITPPEGPFLPVGIDYCGPLKRIPRENQYVLIITDYFTRGATASVLLNCTAETTAQPRSKSTGQFQ